MEFALISALGVMSFLLLLSWVVLVLMPIFAPIIGIIVVLAMHGGFPRGLRCCRRDAGSSPRRRYGFCLKQKGRRVIKRSKVPKIGGGKSLKLKIFGNDNSTSIA